ncbi:protein kinase C and casein kinase substrate in neurons protein 2-like [Ptychodera flava]|uniref:protein kinase C and casein kinase substrate in neurons protein 2-like n=1 Tax=Ptychodera flava TaxID=63121 RepID=UPI00396A2224
MAIFESIYKQAYGVIQSADAGKDLESWRTKYGTGMEPNWPKFEDYDIHADGRKFSFFRKRVRPSQSAREDGLLDDEFDSDDFEDFSDETDGDSNPKEVNGHHHVTASRQKDEDDSPYQNITPRGSLGAESPGGQSPGAEGTSPSTARGSLDMFAVRALYDFEPASDDELQLRAGDILTQIGSVHDNGWAYGRLRDRLGLFPANYVEALR